MVVNKILQYLTDKQTTVSEEYQQLLTSDFGELCSTCFRRQFIKESFRDKLSVSGAGKCPRQQAYKHLGFEINGKEIDSRARMVFAYGDLIEALVINLAKLSGCVLTHTGKDQMNVTVNVGNYKFVGHPDGILVTDKKRLIEIKSMTDFAFNDFVRGKLSPDYRVQFNLYLDGARLDECVYIAVNKQSGVMHEVLYKKDSLEVIKGKTRLLSALGASKDSLPDRPEELRPEGGFYRWDCLYCAYWKSCLPNAERVLVRNRYKLKEKPWKK